MKTLFVFVSCLLAVVLAEEELEIVIEFVPDDCQIKSKNGDVLTYHYTGTFLDGTVFDSSVGRDPYRFQLGAGQVIMGMEQALIGVCAGEKLKVTIPSHLAYGERGYGTVIPPAATLVFDVEMLTINRDEKPAETDYFKIIDKDGDNQLSRQEVIGYVEDWFENEGANDGAKDDQNPLEITDNFFRDRDQDKDGFVSVNEFPGNKRDEL